MSATEPRLTPQQSDPKQTKRLLTLAGVSVLAITAAGILRHLAEAEGPTPAQMTASAAFTVLTQPQRSIDQVTDPRARFIVKPGTTRYLGRTAAGRHWVGVSLTGDHACLLTGGAGTNVDSSCAELPEDGSQPVLSMIDPAGPDLALVPDSYQVSAPWRSQSTNLIVNEATSQTS